MNTNSSPASLSSPAPISLLHRFCVTSFSQMIIEGREEHVSYITAEDLHPFPLPPGKIGKVLITLVDEVEALPEDPL